jgi:signal transduction histidine kinase
MASIPAPADAETLALAHALRTPLTSLSLGVGLLEVIGPLNKAQADVVAEMTREVARLSLLVDRTLRTERLGAYAGPVDRRLTDFGALIKRAAAPIAAQARERSVKLSSSLPPGINVVVDVVKLTWVVASVLGNALRYSPPGGRVQVRLVETQGEAELHVADQGPGLAPEVQERLFERSGGTGLFLAREIIEAHGGSIGVTSAPGGGSVFAIRVPVVGQKEGARDERDEQEG